jgi:hypothetical protein
MQNKKVDIKKISRPDMATQSFNPRSLTIESSIVVVFVTCETSKKTWSKVSDRGLKLCGANAISGRAIFFISTLFVLHQDYKTSSTDMTDAVGYKLTYRKLSEQKIASMCLGRNQMLLLVYDYSNNVCLFHSSTNILTNIHGKDLRRNQRDTRCVRSEATESATSGGLFES